MRLFHVNRSASDYRTPLPIYTRCINRMLRLQIRITQDHQDSSCNDIVEIFHSKRYSDQEPLSDSNGEQSRDYPALLPATVMVPGVWPHVINRNPVFPRFITFIEISNPILIDLIHRKI